LIFLEKVYLNIIYYIIYLKSVSQPFCTEYKINIIKITMLYIFYLKNCFIKYLTFIIIKITIILLLQQKLFYCTIIIIRSNLFYETVTQIVMLNNINNNAINSSLKIYGKFYCKMIKLKISFV